MATYFNFTCVESLSAPLQACLSTVNGHTHCSQLAILHPRRSACFLVSSLSRCPIISRNKCFITIDSIASVDLLGSSPSCLCRQQGIERWRERGAVQKGQTDQQTEATAIHRREARGPFSEKQSDRQGTASGSTEQGNRRRLQQQ